MEAVPVDADGFARQLVAHADLHHLVLVRDQRRARHSAVHSDEHPVGGPVHGYWGAAVFVNVKLVVLDNLAEEALAVLWWLESVWVVRLGGQCCREATPTEVIDVSWTVVLVGFGLQAHQRQWYWKRRLVTLCSGGKHINHDVLFFFFVSVAHKGLQLFDFQL